MFAHSLGRGRSAGEWEREERKLAKFASDSLAKMTHRIASSAV